MSRPTKMQLLRDRRFVSQFARELAADAFDRRRVIHFLHIGKNAGSHVWHLAAKVNRSQARLRFRKHGHETKLIDLPPRAQYFFSIRDPVTRFVSAFYERKSRPEDWSPHERLSFERYEHAVELAEELPRPGVPSDQAAVKAILSISHASMNQRDWFDRAGHFLELRPPLHIVRVESLEDDIARMFEKLGLEPSQAGPDGRTRVGPYAGDGAPPLTPMAINNLKLWYAQDVAFYDACCRWLAVQP